MTAPVLLWLRRDLRLADQAALVAACAAGPVVPVYVLDDETPQHRKLGGASRWWLHHSLSSLAAALEAKGSRLILWRGRCETVLAALSQSAKFDAAGYVRQWVPELAHLPDADIHDPVFAVKGYLAKLIGHTEARARALAAWAAVKGTSD